MFTVIKSPVGLIEIGSDQNFITSLYFKDEPYTIHGKNEEMTGLTQECIQQLHQYFEGSRKVFTLPLFQEGTVFQQKIWELLREIPYGKTISYADLARRYGEIKAVRAVGTANGRNALSVLVPCHRVIGSDGKLIGYGGGLWRKQWLLEHEARFSSGIQRLF